jgi:hypothetical protein
MLGGRMQKTRSVVNPAKLRTMRAMADAWVLTPRRDVRRSTDAAHSPATACRSSAS